MRFTSHGDDFGAGCKLAIAVDEPPALIAVGQTQLQAFARGHLGEQQLPLAPGGRPVQTQLEVAERPARQQRRTGVPADQPSAGNRPARRARVAVVPACQTVGTQQVHTERVAGLGRNEGKGEQGNKGE